MMISRITHSLLLITLVLGLVFGAPAAAAQAQAPATPRGPISPLITVDSDETPEPGITPSPEPTNPTASTDEPTNPSTPRPIPTVNAGSIQTVNTERFPVIHKLSGTITPENSFDAVQWTVEQGGDSAYLANPNSLVTDVHIQAPGTYVFRLTAMQLNSEGGLVAAASNVTTVTVTGPSAPQYSRPLLVIDSYSYGGDAVTPNTNFTLTLRLANRGGSPANNIVATFGGTDFIPQNTGGVVAVSELGGGAKVDVAQPMLASSALLGMPVGSVTVGLTYTDSQGNTYTENFTLSINVKQPSYGPAQPTATPTLAPVSAQLVIGEYETDVESLQPGSIFNLRLTVQNLGARDAKAVSMILGGGTLPANGQDGTPGPGGVSGSGSDTSIFAPLGSSNIVYLGDLPAGESLSTESQLIVNVTANPGAYPLKISFVYTDEKGSRAVDDQVITLLIYRVPQIDVSFYTDPGIFYTGQFGMLPLQVTNIGRSSALLGTMRVTAEGAEIMNGQVSIGALEPGGYYPLDAQIIPQTAGPLDLLITISYTDDFNQLREVTQTLTINVEEMTFDPGIDPVTGFPIDPVTGLPIDPNTGMPVDPTTGMPGGNPGGQGSETIWQTLVRVLKGLIGLDSGPVQASPMNGGFEGRPDVAPMDGGVIVGPKG